MSSSNISLEEVTVRSLRHDEAPLVGDVIADSHADYPSFSYLFTDRARRERVLRRLMTGVAGDASAYGHVSVAVRGDRMLGAAVWLPPGAFPWTTRRKLRAGATFLPLLWQTRGATSDFFTLGARAETSAPAEPHWNLQVLGVRVEAQGRGLGGRLLRPVLSRADRDGVLCYLETADPANIAFYERFGFELDRRHELIPEGPPHYSMRRPPRNRHSKQGGS